MNEDLPPIYETLAQDPRTPLYTLTGEELAEYRFKRVKWVVEDLLSPGLVVLAGSPKVGKSWFVLQLCMCVAKGEPFWGLKTRAGTVLYYALEDGEQRLQKRLYTVTDEASPQLYFAMHCSSMADDLELEREVGSFFMSHPDLRLIVIDTFQMVRDGSQQMSYANDYSDVARLKRLADALHICILLVHHTRKLGDSDRFNEISGTNGISGSADTLMVLSKEKRTDRTATLCITGRDIEDRELTLTLDKNCLWRCDSPLSEYHQTVELPQGLHSVIALMKQLQRFEGSNADFAAQLSRFTNKNVNAQTLKKSMNRYRYELEDEGVQFMSTRTNNRRGLLIIYKPVESSDPDRDASSCRSDA